MIKQVITDIVGILLVYILYAMVIVLIYDPESFLGDDWPIWPVFMWCCSLAATLLWYLIGELVIRPSASPAVWLGVWFLLLAVVVLCAGTASYFEWVEQTDASIFCPELHFSGGIGAYYLSGVLFSPLLGKYMIWPAQYVRKW